MNESLWTYMGWGTPNSKNVITNMTSIEKQVYLYLESLIVNRYEYKNLPKGMETYLIEDILFWRGQCMAFKYPGTDTILCLPCATAENLDVYGRLQYASPMSYNGTPMPYKVRCREDLLGTEKQEGVLFMNNLTTTSTYGLIKPFVDQFIYILQSKMNNCAMARKPVIIKGNKKTAAALNSQFTQIFGNQINPLKVAYDDQDLSSMLEVLDLNIKYDQAEYWDDLKNTWNWILTLCGISNNENVAKKERLITSESMSNEEEVNGLRYDTLAFRQKAIAELNRVFGLNASIEYRYSPDEEEGETKQDQKEEQDND